MTWFWFGTLEYTLLKGSCSISSDTLLNRPLQSYGEIDFFKLVGPWAGYKKNKT
jgi:hypothetical protein